PPAALDQGDHGRQAQAARDGLGGRPRPRHRPRRRRRRPQRRAHDLAPAAEGGGSQDRGLRRRLGREGGRIPEREGADLVAGLLVYVHHDDGELSPQGLGLLARAAELGGEVTAFVAGSGIDDGWAGSLGGHGAARVLVADDAALGGAGVVSADVAAGLAARLGAGIACETTDIAMADGGLVATRPALDDT